MTKAKIFCQILAVIFLAATFAVIDCDNRTYAAASPPKEYIVDGKSPGEYPVVEKCLTVRKAATMYDSPRGKNVIGKLNVGDKVDSVYCRVYTAPYKFKVKVLRSFSANTGVFQSSKKITIPAGETIYIAMFLGEYNYLGWYNGNLLWWLDGRNINNLYQQGNKHTKINANPWGEYIGEEMARDDTPKIELWNLIMKADGTTGWVKIWDYENRSISPFIASKK